VSASGSLLRLLRATDAKSSIDNGRRAAQTVNVIELPTKANQLASDPGPSRSMISPGVAALIVLLSVVVLSVRYRPDLMAFVGLIVLVLLGSYDLESALSFLVSPAVVVLFGSMAISGVIADSGLLELVSRATVKRIRRMVLVSLLLYFVMALAAGFISDVALVLVVLPLLIDVARRFNVPAASYALSAAFAVTLGGRLTMIGNAGNVVLLDVYRLNTGQSLDILAFTVPALITVLLAIPPLVVLAWFAQRLMPQFRAPSKSVVVMAVLGKSLHGRSRREVERELGIKFLAQDKTLREGDLVPIKLSVSDIPSLQVSDAFSLVTLGEAGGEHMEFLIVTQRSRLVDKSLSMEPIHKLFPVKVMGVVPSRRIKYLEGYVFRPGDELLVVGDEKAVESVASYYRLERSRAPVKSFNLRLAAFGIGGLALAVLLSQFTSTALAFALGTLLALLGGGRAVERLYNYVSWETLIYVGAFIAIGQVASEADLLRPLASLLSRPEQLFAVTVLFTNALGLVPSAVLLGPLLSSKEAIKVYVLATLPMVLPFAHPAIYLAYRTLGITFRDFLKFSLPATAISALVTLLVISYPV